MFIETKKDSTKTPSNNKFIYELDLGSNRSFKGRINSTKLPYMRPNFTYYHQSGFVAYIDATYIMVPKPHWDQTCASVGYTKYLNKTFSLSGSYSHSFFNSKSQQVNSSLTDNPSISLKAYTKYVTSRLTYDYYFGTSTDKYVTLDFYKYFYIDNILTDTSDYLAIKPKFSVTAGTTTFYTRHKRLKDGTYVPPTSTSKFNVVNYYFSLNLPYTYKKFSIEPAFGYNFPVNQPPKDAIKPYTVFCVYTYLTF